MTTLQAFEPFTLWQTQGQKEVSIDRSRGWKRICAVLMCAAAAIASPAQTLKTLASFTGTNGDEPYLATLVQSNNGNFYGTTQYGGTHTGTDCSLGCGTVFEVSPAGKLTTLYDFCSQANCADGSVPTAGLVQGGNGNFYGTTVEGGTNSLGTVFGITPAGKLTTLHSFDGTDGALLQAGLIQATNGDFYGTATLGGTGRTCSGGGCGTVFKITPGGTLTTLHSFDGTDGEYLYAGLVQATNGNFYGTTYLGGANDYGTVFEITSGGTLTTMHSFDFTDGAEPLGGLVQARTGNFYGTTSAGGSIGAGTVFEITAAGTLTTLYNFCTATECEDGELPATGLVQGTNGDLYGTTFGGGSGGTLGDGTVFSLAVGLQPFVETRPTSGKVGTAVRILGTDLTGATSVTFNGAAAVFKVVSSSLITTTVPAGATTGNVQVVTPSRTLTSNKKFHVLP